VFVKYAPTTWTHFKVYIIYFSQSIHAFQKEEHLQLVLQWTDKMLTAYPHCSTFSVIVAEIHCQLSVCKS